MKPGLLRLWIVPLVCCAPTAHATTYFGQHGAETLAANTQVLVFQQQVPKGYWEVTATANASTNSSPFLDLDCYINANANGSSPTEIAGNETAFAGSTPNTSVASLAMQAAVQFSETMTVDMYCESYDNSLQLGGGTTLLIRPTNKPITMIPPH